MNLKIIIYIGLICFLSMDLSAQRTQVETHVLHLGAHAGWLVKDFDNFTDRGTKWNAYGEFPLSRKWSMSIGVGFIDLGVQSHMLDVTNASGIMVSGADLRVFREGTFNYKYMTIPIYAKWRLNRFYVSMGVVPHFYFNHQIIYGNQFKFVPSWEVGETFDPADLRTPNIAASVGLGYRVNIGELLSVYIEPRWNTFLAPTYKDGREGVSRSYFAVNIGIRKTLLIKMDVTQKVKEEEPSVED